MIEPSDTSPSVGSVDALDALDALMAAAIVLAGGSGSRVQADVNKVYLPIRGRDMLEYSLDTMDRSSAVASIVLVVRPSDVSAAKRLITEAGLSTPARITIGGTSRHRSEIAGLDTIRDEIVSGAIDLVAIHDGARPFMTLRLLEEVIETAQRFGGAVPGLAIDQPLYRAGPDELELLPGASLRRVQTPQAFRARSLLEAYDRSIEDGFEGVDTAETVERFSDLDVRIVAGDPRNIKVTFAEDLSSAGKYAGRWHDGAWRR